MSDIASRRHAKGLAITSFAVVVMSVDSLLLRLIDGDEWTVSAWRGLLTGSMLWLALIIFRGPRNALSIIASFGGIGFFAAAIYGVQVIGFVSGLHRTNVATIMVIMSATPFVSAIVGFLIYRQRTPIHTWIAIAVGSIGIWIAVSGPAANNNIFGVALCMLAALCFGTYLTILQNEPRLDTVATTGFGSLLYGCVAVGIGQPFALDGGQMGLMLVLGLVVLPVSFGLFTLGPRYISSAETGLVLLLETVLAPLWVWLVLSEQPAPTAIIGGTIVIATLIVHTIVGLRISRRRRPVVIR